MHNNGNKRDETKCGNVMTKVERQQIQDYASMSD